MKKNIVTLTEDTCKVLGELNSKGKHSSQTSPIKEEDLQGFKRIRKFIPMLDRLLRNGNLTGDAYNMLSVFRRDIP
ncbi:MAG: hypothetical protein V1749_00505 [Candidatus Desantisbacteria bacterium]